LDAKRLAPVGVEDLSNVVDVTEVPAEDHVLEAGTQAAHAHLGLPDLAIAVEPLKSGESLEGVIQKSLV
jgi:hypothetical protein